MRHRFALAVAATLALAAPAAAIVQTGTLVGAAGDLYQRLPASFSDEGPGVYALSLRFSQPGASLVVDFERSYFYTAYCNFDGLGFEVCAFDEEYDGGVYREYRPGVTRVDLLFKVPRPERIGDATYYEDREYYLDSAYVDYEFAAPGSVDWRAEFVRVAAIPEPATWLLLVAGFGLAGAALRRRTIPSSPACGRGERRASARPG